MKLSDAVKTGTEEPTVEERVDMLSGRVLNIEAGIMNFIGSLARMDPEWGYAIVEQLGLILDEEDEDVTLEDETTSEVAGT